MQHVTLAQLNDLHGYAAAHAELFDLAHEERTEAAGGLGRIAAVLAAIRREAPTLFLDNGDTFHGTMAAVQTAGDALVEPMTLLAPDAATIHWEFAYGLDRLRALADRLRYPILAANCRDTGGELALRPFTLVDRGGIRIGIVGLAAVVAAQLLPAAERARIELTIGDRELGPIVAALRRDHGAALVVVLSHLGFPQDCKLASVVPGIDVILSGHTHTRLAAPLVVGSTVIMQSGAHGSFVGRLDLDVARDGIAAWRHSLVRVDATWEPDAATEAAVERALQPFAAARGRVLAWTARVLHRYAMLESPMDNLLLDAVAAAAGTEVALSNGWRYGAPIPPGPLTTWDAWNIVPANPPVSVTALTGRDLRDLFEQNLEATFACDPWDQRGGYVKRCRGIELLAKIEHPRGHRVHELTVEGTRVGDDEVVDVAFLGEQAVPLHMGRDRRGTGIRAVDALERYLRERREVSPAVDGRVRLV